jgi:hypothetical protein
MLAGDKPNPFSVLELPTDATRADIVARSDELHNTAETKEDSLLFRWAKEQLITNPQVRLEYEFFELPGTEYEDPAWDNFRRTHKKKPVDLNALREESPPPGLDAIDLAALLHMFAETLLPTTSEADITSAIDGTPFIPVNKLLLEVEDVIFG